MANLTRSTRDREEIRRWAEERGGRPAHVRQTGSGEDVGILRIDFPGYTGEETLEPIDWQRWFDKFEDRDLVLIYQEETAGGQRSNFNKIVSAETAGEAAKKKTAAGAKKKGAAAKKATKKAAKSAAKTGAKKAAAKKRAARSAKKAVKKTATRRAKSAAKKAGPRKTAKKKSATRKRR